MTRRRSSRACCSVFVLGLVLGLAACNQAPPPGSEGEDSEGSEGSGEDQGELDGEEAGSLYPMVSDASWTYVARTTQGQILGTEIAEVHQIQWQGESAWLLSDQPDEDGEWTESILVERDNEVLRVYKEEHGPMGIFAYVYYDPGFLRADDDWLEASVDDYEQRLYDRTEYDNPDMLNPDLEPRGHAYKIIGVNESVTVPAGTFDCIVVERIRTVGTNAGERVLSWYAPGVGKVREERPADSRIEELSEVRIPGGAQFP